MHNASKGFWTTGERERLVWSIFPGCASGRLCFPLWPSYSPFLGKSETKSREAVAWKEKGTGKLTLGRTGGESPHSKSDKERCWSFWDGSVEHKIWQIETKKWDTDTDAFASWRISKLICGLPTLTRCPKSNLQSNLSADSPGMQS